MPIKIRNTTDFPDRFLRGLLCWCVQQTECAPGWIKEAWFRNRSRGAWSGRAFLSQRRIVCSIGPESCYPVHEKRERDFPFVVNDRVEGLIYLTTHEIFHHRQYRLGLLDKVKQERNCERQARLAGFRAVVAFRENRANLESRWGLHAPSLLSPAAAEPSIRERRYARAQKSLARWQRRLKLAQTKVKKYRKQVRYYERALGVAAEKGETSRGEET